MVKSYIKSKSTPNAAGPKYRTPDHFKGSVFSGAQSKFGSGNISKGSVPKLKFNPAQFKTQHKG